MRKSIVSGFVVVGWLVGWLVDPYCMDLLFFDLVVCI